MSMNCLIIEDQLPAQRILKTYLKDMPQMNLVGACTNAMDASVALQENQIDLIFLDINLPKISGISFLKNLSQPPKIIITTAYPDYALEGFELDVVDYLLKPFSFERFHKAVMKVAKRPELTGKAQDFIFIKSDKEFHKLDINSILFLQSDDNYVKVFTNESMHMQTGSLQNWMADLPAEFIRVHKSYIVNLSKVKKLSGNRLFIDEHEIPVGRSFREALLKKIEN